MGFLDNSGDIILDAVLTDLGRKKMADGTFSITKFAVGDDEIDYGLYNKNNAAGSAYYDLEILQTPIMEAFTQTNAGINYGLLTNTATNILYLPVMDINTKSINQGLGAIQAIAGAPNVYHVAANTNNTVDKLTNNLGPNYFATSGGTTTAILLEAGLNTPLLNGTEANRSSYLVSNNLVDTSFYVYYDNRFINSILGPGNGSQFTNTLNPDGSPTLEISLTTAPSVTTDLQLENYSTARINGPIDAVYYNAAYSTADTAVSVISGPRSSFTLLNVELNPNLNTEYSKYGKKGVSLGYRTGGNNNTYNYLDTIVYIQGTRTGTQIQVPLRLITLNTAV